MPSEDVDPIIDARVLLLEDTRDHQFLFIKRLNKIGITNFIISTIEKYLEELLSAYSDMDELDENFIHRTRRIFLM